MIKIESKDECESFSLCCVGLHGHLILSRICCVLSGFRFEWIVYIIDSAEYSVEMMGFYCIGDVRYIKK